MVFEVKTNDEKTERVDWWGKMMVYYLLWIYVGRPCKIIIEKRWSYFDEMDTQIRTDTKKMSKTDVIYKLRVICVTLCRPIHFVLEEMVGGIDFIGVEWLA